MGRLNAPVFPVPVWPSATRSLSSSRMKGMTALWIYVGSLNPSNEIPSSNSFRNPNSRNVILLYLYLSSLLVHNRITTTCSPLCDEQFIRFQPRHLRGTQKSIVPYIECCMNAKMHASQMLLFMQKRDRSYDIIFWNIKITVRFVVLRSTE